MVTSLSSWYLVYSVHPVSQCGKADEMNGIDRMKIMSPSTPCFIRHSTFDMHSCLGISCFIIRATATTRNPTLSTPWYGRNGPSWLDAACGGKSRHEPPRTTRFSVDETRIVAAVAVLIGIGPVSRERSIRRHCRACRGVPTRSAGSCPRRPTRARRRCSGVFGQPVVGVSGAIATGRCCLAGR